MAHYNIIARQNGVGLDRDVSLIREELIAMGHEVTVSHRKEKNYIHRVLQRTPEYDVNIFIERVFPNWVPFAEKNILIPNQERFPRRHISRLKKVDLVLAKTRHAETIFTELGCRTAFTSFTSEDLNLDEISPDYNKFLHLAGRSTMKGTEGLLTLWNKNPEWPVLTLVQCSENAPSELPSNVFLMDEYVPKEGLREILNSHGVHLCPSSSEGWGHYIAEALACKALVVTTDAPPMNELVSRERGVLVPYAHKEPRHLGMNFFVDIDELEKAIISILEKAEAEKVSIGNQGRSWFLENDQRFRELMREFV